MADALRAVCRWEDGLEAARQAQAIAAEASLDRCQLEAVIAETNILMARGDFDLARPKLEHVALATDDPRLRGIALQNIGTIHAQCGHAGAAERAFRESLGNFHRAGYRRGECIALNNLGRLALEMADTVRARPMLEDACAIAREIEDLELAALTSLNLAWSLCHARELDRAQDLVMSCLGHFSAAGNRWREIECFRLLGEIDEHSEDLTNAARCYQIALAIAEQIGAELEVRVTRDRLAAVTRKVMGAPATQESPVALPHLPADATGGTGDVTAVS
jgi:tetratricopeptide (TPR) repeat protein